MSVLHIDEVNSFDNYIKNNNMVVVVFSASFCKPCREIYPYVEEIANTNKDIVFIKVDIENGSEISDKFSIQSIPHFKFFKNGSEVGSFTGANNQSILDAIAKLRK
jgi:thioredoxin 1